jgi:hypothetical protein
MKQLIALSGIAILAFNATAAEVELSTDYKSFIESRLAAQEKWMREAIIAQDEKAKLALQAAERANEKFERSSNERFNSQNEFRSQLKDQAGTFITRTEALAYFAALVGFVAWVSKKKDKE